jgi:hypothetical protein
MPHLTKDTKVQNCEDTTSDIHPNGSTSWIDALDKTLDYHEKGKSTKCIVKEHHKDGTEIVGAHVHLEDGEKQYIIPMCKHHNGQRSHIVLPLIDNVIIFSKKEISLVVEKLNQKKG